MPKNKAYTKPELVKRCKADVTSGKQTLLKFTAQKDTISSMSSSSSINNNNANNNNDTLPQQLVDPSISKFLSTAGRWSSVIITTTIYYFY